MREIKFRAWDGEKMRDWGFMGQGEFRGPPSENGALDYPQMQYTGLKDKNGKEIYEGDIIRGKAHSLKKRIDIWEVTYSTSEASHGMKARNGIENRTAHYIVEAHGYEIIGNIYENPELLA